MSNIDDIRSVQIEATRSAQNLGDFVSRDHVRDILALKYNVSGPATSGIIVTIYDKWGTSNRVVDQHIFKTHQLSGEVQLTHMWPMCPRPDLPIGRVKGSGVASVQTSGGLVNIVMVYTDRPGGRV